MPYIAPERRTVLEDNLCPETTGELNWLLSTIAADYIARKGLSYQSCAEARIALLDAAEELYRRVVADYEDTKIVQNGDVYPEGILNGGVVRVSDN